MKTDLKAKFLQHLNYEKPTQGFTLIELLVVIVIIGVLAAIAIPTYMNQSAKAKQSEAKKTVASVNRSQTAHRSENSTFAPDLASLSLGLKTVTDYYTYTVVGEQNTASIIAQAGDSALRGYTGGNVAFNNVATLQSAVASIVCEVINAGTSRPADPNLEPAQQTAEAAATCDNTTQRKL